MDPTLTWLVLIGGMVVFMFWNQWRSRKQYQKKMEALQPGDKVVTIGGFYGTLSDVDQATGRARLEIAPGVQVEISTRAISHQVAPTEEEA